MKTEHLIKEITAKYQGLNENPESYLNGLLHAKPINYWDYVEVETLLTLQKPRTNFKDEEIFIMYHQITELVLKMMLHELKQMVYNSINEAVWIEKLTRLNRYTSMLINSFDVMRSGMNYEDYNTFRSTLTPASGFQSVQFRLLELYCTRLPNLLNKEGKAKLSASSSISEHFEYLYWKNAGINKKTGKKTLTLLQFEEQYQSRLIGLANKLQGNTLEDKFQHLENCSEELKKKMKTFDYSYNVAWPLVHLQTAQHYLDKKGETKAATGGSEWKKYLDPKYQQRRFFPELWEENELIKWGEQTNG